MYTINDIKVELLNPEEVKNFIKNHDFLKLSLCSFFIN